MRRSLLVLVSLLALGSIVPAAATEAVPLTNGAYTATGECDPGVCRGTTVFDGTFAVGGVEVTDVVTFDWAGDDVPPHTFAGSFVGEHLAGACTIEDSPVPVVVAIPRYDGTMTCDASVDGGATQTFSLVLVMTGTGGDGPADRPIELGRFLGT